MNLNPIRANMTELQIGPMRVLFSYKTPVAVINEDGTADRTSTFWSRTTSRHINAWLSGVKDVGELPQEFFDGLVK